jgi:hypothetical protein
VYILVVTEELARRFSGWPGDREVSAALLAGLSKRDCLTARFLERLVHRRSPVANPVARHVRPP